MNKKLDFTDDLTQLLLILAEFISKVLNITILCLCTYHAALKVAKTNQRIFKPEKQAEKNSHLIICWQTAAYSHVQQVSHSPSFSCFRLHFLQKPVSNPDCLPFAAVQVAFFKAGCKNKTMR